ncbi:uncharacterized protein [Polyergus mexicanus]|uniref:uncharacterized protein n=1 Tax=Polyergus mexicanus TaxID=615972 RepID=UPI0038B5208A
MPTTEVPSTAEQCFIPRFSYLRIVMNSRGPYRKYLQDAREEVPATTIQSRRRNEIQAELIFNNQEENNAVVNIIGMHDEALQQFEEINEHSSIDENNSSDDEIYNNQVNNANDEENIFDDAHGEDGNNEEMRQPIYENCPLTQDESDLLIMSFIIRRGLTDLAFDDLLNLINCHLPITLNFSRHLFLKKFPKTANMKTIFYCPECFVELNFEQMTHINCTSCNTWYMRIDLVRGGHYFVHLPLKDQLRNLLSGPLFYKLQRSCAEQSSILSDITSGESYRRLRRNGVIRDYDITLQWNSDGVDTFKSSKVSMCPIQVAINELPYCLRKENILLSSIWCSAKKPVMDLFLKPFVDDLKDLHENGFHCLPPGLDAPVHVRVHTIVAPVDSVARCALQNVHQFNGKFGCSFCLCPGDRVKVGNDYARVYLEKVILETGATAFVVVGNSIEILEDITLCSHYNISSASYCYAVEITNNILTCKPEQITNKCILLPGDNDTTNYIMPLVNNKETD